MTNYYTVVCKKCNAADYVIDHDMDYKEAKEHFEIAGWKFGKKKLRCPECASKQTGS